MKRIVAYLITCLLVLSVQAEKLTYTVVKYNEVSLTNGTAPVGSEAAFYCTTASGKRISSDDVATFTLTGWGGCQLTKLVLSMRSNQSSGAGSFTMHCGTNLVAEKQTADFSAPSWYGSFSSEFVPIEITFPKFMVGTDDNLVLAIAATVNSLYIESFTIDYVPAAAQKHTVLFETNISQVILPQTESIANSGIILPSCKCPIDEWQFLGWTTQRCATTTIAPDYLPAGTQFFPKSNTTLYALYSNNKPIVCEQDTALSDGFYLMATSYYDAMAHGPVEKMALGGFEWSGLPGAKMQLDSINNIYTFSADYIPLDALYEVHKEDSSLFLMHLSTLSPIGFANGALSSKTTAWHYREALHHTAALSDDKGYLLMSDYGTSIYDTLRFKCDKNFVYISTVEYLIFLRYPDDYFTFEALYSAYPGGGNALENQVQGNDILVTPWQIINPKNSFLQLFDIQGRQLISSSDNISLEMFARGIYILKSPSGTRKIYVP